MKEYRICTRCVMDTSADDITFDENGYCNYCTDFINQLELFHSDSESELEKKREYLIKKVKKDGQNKPYDCIVGVSGGVDSSYVLYLTKQYGLRPLAVHLDNGWNSELATHNISNLCNKLGVDLYTHVIDWEENRDMQLSFFAANVIDIELLMDNAMAALNYNQSKKYNLKYMLSGTNSATEGMRMPYNWNHYKYDKKNILSIHKKFGKVKIETHPLFSTWDFLWNRYIINHKWISFLDYFVYNKAAALKILQKEVDYKPYPYKHYESVFTRFYQGYILPHKFNVDKRRLHLSTLIIAGQMAREEALKHFNSSPYADPAQEKQDKEFVMKKLGFTEERFEKYIKTPGVSHEYYGSEKWLMNLLVYINGIRKKIIK
ncbi:LPS biosynthesis protein WbpG [Spirochaetia bacterium]|nr:LPS biosynthesis protein WbpG [Spirochaetia bacterium]